MKIEPIGAYPYPLDLSDYKDVLDQVENLYLLEISASNVEIDLNTELFYQEEEWVWYDSTYLDYATSLPIPKPNKDYILLREEAGFISRIIGKVIPKFGKEKIYKVSLNERVKESAHREGATIQERMANALDSFRKELASPADLIEPPPHPTDGSRFRVIFFIHQFDHEKPVRTPVGEIFFPIIPDIPDRLRWKKYVYWD
jgi:hypothetical protein